MRACAQEYTAGQYTSELAKLSAATHEWCRGLPACTTDTSSSDFQPYTPTMLHQQSLQGIAEEATDSERSDSQRASHAQIPADTQHCNHAAFVPSGERYTFPIDPQPPPLPTALLPAPTRDAFRRASSLSDLLPADPRSQSPLTGQGSSAPRLTLQDLSPVLPARLNATRARRVAPAPFSQPSCGAKPATLAEHGTAPQTRGVGQLPGQSAQQSEPSPNTELLVDAPSSSGSGYRPQLAERFALDMSALLAMHALSPTASIRSCQSQMQDSAQSSGALDTETEAPFISAESQTSEGSSCIRDVCSSLVRQGHLVVGNAFELSENPAWSELALLYLRSLCLHTGTLSVGCVEEVRTAATCFSWQVSHKGFVCLCLGWTSALASTCTKSPIIQPPT